MAWSSGDLGLTVIILVREALRGAHGGPGVSRPFRGKNWVWPVEGLFGASWDGCSMRGRHDDVPCRVPLPGQFALGMK